MFSVLTFLLYDYTICAGSLFIFLIFCIFSLKQNYHMSYHGTVHDEDGVLSDEGSTTPGDDALPMDCDPANLSKTQEISIFFTKLQELVPSKFEIKQTSDKWFEKGFGSSGVEGTGVSSTASRPSLILNPDLRGSWLDPAEKAAPADLVGYWPSHVNIPPSPIKCTPPNFPTTYPHRIKDFTYTDQQLKVLLEAKKFKKLAFDPAAFESCSKDVTSSPLANMDILLRSSLTDCFITESLHELMAELLPILKLDKEQSEILTMVLHLTASSNFRLLQQLLAAFVSNKASLRDVVLKDFIVPPYSLPMLKGSTFKGPSLFGPLPDFPGFPAVRVWSLT